MCRLQASDVREELVSAAAREAEQDFVYGEIKPVARGDFFATSAGRQASFGLLAGPKAPVGRRHCWLPGEGEGEEQLGPGPGALCCMSHPVLTCYLQHGQEATVLCCTLTHSMFRAPTWPFLRLETQK